MLLAFSGGGTRAAALSYGVMQELRDTIFIGDDKKIRLLDEVDLISSVSGGSFTAAYYGVYRDKLFEDFEDVFLRQGIQQALIRELLNPVHWIRSLFTGFDRTEMAVDYYDRQLFKGATFDDIAANGPPYIDINATDLTTGMRFTFNQDLFDLICTNLGSYPVARAVTASSAVPVLFPTIVLKNHADKCDIRQSRNWGMLKQARAKSAAQAMLVEGLMSYRDAKEREYIHLIDGGIADNLGLRTMIDRNEGLGHELFDKLKAHRFQKVLIILVNAAVNPNRLIEQTPEKPSVSATMNAFTSAQINRYNQETLDRLRQNIAQLETRTTAEGLEASVFFSELSFDQVQTDEANKLLNSLPTSLELEDIEVDRVIATGRMLLRHNPQFVQLKKRIGASLAEDAVNDEVLCRMLSDVSCQDVFGED